jgi:hypothetical protein
MMMPRSSYRPLAALGLVATLMAYVGCGLESGPSPKEVSPTVAATPGPAAIPKPKLFADWPDPAGALLISGEQDGYLEPCGCSEGQLGGLRRRSELIERIRARGWPLALVDLGSLIKSPASARGGFEQAKIKFDVALKALSLMKYNALALGTEDLKVGVDEALGRFLNLDQGPKVVAANVVPAPGFEVTVVPSVKTAAGPVKIGLTAVIDPDALKSLPDPARDALLPTVKAPEEVLPTILTDLRKDTTIQVLMVQGPPGLARTLAKTFPGFAVVVATSTSDAAPDAPEMLNDGRTMLVTVGQKGKYVGVVGIFPDPDPKKAPSLRYQRVTLGTGYNGPAEPMRKLIEDDFQKMLEQAGVVENFPRRAYVGVPAGATFIGAEACKSCHPNTFAKWSTTAHAKAFEDIVHDPKGKRSDHQFDAECISCHTTGFEYNSGWKSAEATPYLKGNQCENCHGPASKHAAEPDNPDFRKAIARTAALADKNGLCLRCHDEDNSPHFEFATYWGKIAHKGLDTYADPKGQSQPIKRAED